MQGVKLLSPFLGGRGAFIHLYEKAFKLANMKHKETKYQRPDGKGEIDKVSCFILTANFGKFKKGEVFEEFYNSRNNFYAISSNLFNPNNKSGHTKIMKRWDVKNAPVSFLKPIFKHSSALWQLHKNGITNINFYKHLI